MHFIVYIGLHCRWYKSAEHSPLGRLMHGTASTYAPDTDIGNDAIVAENDIDGYRSLHVPAPTGHGDPERGVSNSNWETQKFVSKRNAFLGGGKHYQQCGGEEHVNNCLPFLKINFLLIEAGFRKLMVTY